MALEEEGLKIARMQEEMSRKAREHNLRDTLALCEALEAGYRERDAIERHPRKNHSLVVLAFAFTMPLWALLFGAVGIIMYLLVLWALMFCWFVAEEG